MLPTIIHFVCLYPFIYEYKYINIFLISLTQLKSDQKSLNLSRIGRRVGQNTGSKKPQLRPSFPLSLRMKRTSFVLALVDKFYLVIDGQSSAEILEKIYVMNCEDKHTQAQVQVSWCYGLPSFANAFLYRQNIWPHSWPKEFVQESHT